MIFAVSSSLVEEGNVTDVDISVGIETVPGAKDAGAINGNVGVSINALRFFVGGSNVSWFVESLVNSESDIVSGHPNHAASCFLNTLFPPF